MTILTDIITAIREAEKLPLGITLGISAERAFEAAARWVRHEGSAIEKAGLQFILQLPRSRTTDFDGWALTFGTGPNPYRNGRRNAA